MPSIPPPEKFDQNLEEWSQYMDRVRYYFLANHVLEKDKLPTYFSLLSREVYAILCQLLSPNHPSTKSFDEVVCVLDKYFKPRILVPVERFRFIKRRQESSESIKDFVKALKHLSTNCDYGDATALDNRLCEQFVYGINSKEIQARLLLEEKMTFDDAIRISLAAETAFKGAKELQEESVTETNNVFYSGKSTKPSFKFKPQSSQSENSSCNHCGSSKHMSSICKLKNAICHSCGFRGHIATICRKRKSDPSKANISVSAGSRSKSRSVNALGATSPETAEDDVFVDFNQMMVNYVNNNASAKPIMLDIKINSVNHSIQLDTGAAVSIISHSFYKKYLFKTKLLPTNLVLRTIKESIKPLGKVVVSASYKKNFADNLEMIVIDDPSLCLIGLPWLGKLDILRQLNQENILPIISNESPDLTRVEAIVAKFPRLFSKKLGEFKGKVVHLSLKEGTVPKFFKARPVPFAIKEAVEQELSKLQDQNIISPITHSDWASPIMVIRKKDNTLRLCGDYKVGVNPSLYVNQYPLPVIEDIFTQLNGGVIFSKLDLSQAYQQLHMDEESQAILTVNTHKGLFRVHRMPFGISPAPAIFQQKIDELLAGLPGVTCYLDDILITGRSLEDHCSNLFATLTRLDEAGVTLNRNKCEFLKTKVEYLGHVIDKDGLHASDSKISAVVEAPIPKDVPQLRSFLGLVGYYRKFLPNLSSVLSPLNRLLLKDVKWSWNQEAEEAFKRVKCEITSTKVLTHYDPKLPITLACDASPTGLGAVISHVFPDSSEHPIAFASRSLSQAEKNYSQLDKEALGILFGVKKFHQFLYGRTFTLLTDHKPLTRIFGSKSQVPSLAAARLQRWALILSAYNYEIKFRSSQDNANADALSRSPATSIFKIQVEEEVDDSLLLAHLDSFPLDDKMIAKETLKDKTLSTLLKFTRDGWPTSIPKGLEPFRSRAEEISIQDGCLLWGLRVIIPSVFRSLLLQELHRHHTGMVRMKMLARSYLWWPKLDSDIEQEVKSCPECAYHSNSPTKAPIHPWIWPNKPWDRIHVDFAGPFLGHNFLIVVDAHSKWPEVIQMGTTSAEQTITALGGLFARYGLPSHVVSDNGTQFTSEIFGKFMKHHAIKHSFSSPYHPSSNGQAERFVQSFKRVIKKKSKDKLSLTDKVHQLLYAYRSTPHVTTRQTPAALFLKRELRTRLDLLRPSVQRVVQNAQDKMMFSRKDPDTTKTFSLGQKVIAREYLSANKWSLGTISKQLGPLTYQVRLANGKIWKRHLDQIKDANMLNELSEFPSLATDGMVTSTPIDQTQLPSAPSIPSRKSARSRRLPARFC